jgi:hypothetical protein
MCMATISKPAVHLVALKCVYSVSMAFGATSIFMVDDTTTQGFEMIGCHIVSQWLA